ncbi:hypothetical protein DSO57_1014344 [Entomophthora muscae]|nr:hypothetical protein DSO57_1014344 [Entomophthora muscae]
MNVPYPDSGDGRYAAKLTDLQWEQFHNAQRAHRNYTEQIGITQSLLITGGLIAPRSSAVAGLLYMIGRQFYYHGYVNHGPSGRFKGAILLDIGLLGLLGVALYSGFILLGF